MKPWIEPKTWASKKAKGGVSGAWVVWFQDRDGNRKTKNFAWSKYPNKSAAKDAARDFAEGEAKEEPTVDSLKITVRQACDRWLEAAEKYGIDDKKPVRKSTLAAYKNHVENYIVPVIGGRLLIDFRKKQAVAKFREELIKFCEESGRTKIMARRAFASFRQVLSYCAGIDLLIRDPSAKMKIALDDEDGEPVVVPRPSEVKAMLQAADRMAAGETDTIRGRGAVQKNQMRKAWVRYRPMLQFLYECGPRISEVMALPWRCVDLENRRIKIEQMADGQEINAPKSKRSTRTKIISQRLADMLRALKEAQGGDRVYVFGNTKDKPESQANFANRCWMPLLKLAGVRRFGRHAMRHFRASMLFAIGKSVKFVQEDLGHSSPMVTLNTYAHVIDYYDGLRSDSHEADLGKFWGEYAAVAEKMM